MHVPRGRTLAKRFKERAQFPRRGRCPTRPQALCLNSGIRLISGVLHQFIVHYQMHLPRMKLLSNCPRTPARTSAWTLPWSKLLCIHIFALTSAVEQLWIALLLAVNSRCQTWLTELVAHAS